MKNSTRYHIIELLRLISDSVLPIIFWISIIFGFDTPCIAILTILCAVIHELGHCGAIAFFGVSFALRGHSSGFRIKLSKGRSEMSTVLTLLAGPFINIILFLLTLLFGNIMDGYIRNFGYISLATGVSNLLPLEGYDGYGALTEIFMIKERYDLIKQLESLSFIFSVSLTFLSLYLIDRYSEGYWIFGLFFIMTLSKIYYFGKYDIFGE